MTKEVIRIGIMNAMKSGDKILQSVLKSILTEFEKSEKQNLVPDFLKIVQKQIAQRKDSIEQFNKGGREDLVQLETLELKYLEAFLPEQLSLETVVEIVKTIIYENKFVGMKDMKNLMSLVSEKIAGKFDTKELGKICKDQLN